MMGRQLQDIEFDGPVTSLLKSDCAILAWRWFYVVFETLSCLQMEIE
jgi:hypothetical protein